MHRIREIGIVALIAAVLSLALAAAGLFHLLSPSPAAAHDLWISKGVYRNPAGEWCCGAEDCGILSKDALKAVAGGYSVRGTVTYGAGVTGNEADGPTRSEPVDEFWPYGEVLPSPDGAAWRCKRHDGSKRCGFAGPPGS